jgi:mannose-6-phosphate isomerase-like protein (cupin superfamily)
MSDHLLPAVVNVDKLLAPHPPRQNFNIINVDSDYAVRVARVEGRFPWHYHPNGDEGWLVWRGRLQIDTAAGSISLGPGDFSTIPAGLRHSPLALEPGTTVIIFNRKELGLVLDDPQADLGGFALHPDPALPAK